MNGHTKPLEGVVYVIDATFSQGYAAAHPDLVASLMRDAALRDLASAIRALGDKIERGLHWQGRGP